MWNSGCEQDSDDQWIGRMDTVDAFATAMRSPGSRNQIERTVCLQKVGVSALSGKMDVSSILLTILLDRTVQGGKHASSIFLTKLLALCLPGGKSVTSLRESTAHLDRLRLPGTTAKQPTLLAIRLLKRKSTDRRANRRC